ncbi:MAG: BREX system P-loop protein BrxC [Allgaiera sp.]|nr:BREX system P-loop protein BrxC [Allgaiera sp.]
MSITLREIFEKPVDRSIDGVIKADDEASLRIELDEYVITGEIGQRLEVFLHAYNNYETANGVWISGFFGSGKSHLLKMLALLLENREVDGTKAFDIFADKLKDDPMLLGALRKAVLIPSKSILFNIDQKADVISKADTDALLAVFQKVFDEMCGYYGKQPHIAQFERDLDERGILNAFKESFEATSDKPWERGREQAILERKNIAQAFAEATGGNPDDAGDILGQYRKDTRVSIEDFANTVKAWIDRQGPTFRLNFFVDEVGQYIADNVKLMTNLQTVAETLNTKCKGQAWVIVTAQQALKDVVGDLTDQQENDFSKIQARFKNRIPLNSADVAEVIQRRLLAKTPDGQIRLGTLHDREENNLKTLFDFSDGSIKLKNYRDRDQFICSYPFPPYQYTLFQMAITALSQHNAFEGKHSSVGERSMLGVFQEVAKQIADEELGGLATFDLMFEGIRTAMKSSVQQSIQIAERNLEDPFAVRVLKALFLVKYVKSFKPTVRNIAVLLLSEFESDQGKQRRKIEEALTVLERYTLIQRNGEIYEFLTDEEKDVEAEIKALDIDPSELSKELETLAFDTILKHRKIKYLATGHEYPFSRKLDDHLLGRDYELAVNIFTPFSGDVETPEAISMRSISREELAVVLNPDVRFIRDLRLFKQTDKFIRQSRSGTGQPGRDRIIAEKGEQNRRREKDLEMRLRKLMGEARMFARGDELEIGGDDPQERILKGFQILVDKVYVNLPMLRGVTYTEADIDKAGQVKDGLFDSDDAGGMDEAEQEILNFVQGQARIGVNVSVKTLIERFGNKPYGWPQIASLCIAAGLSAKGKLEARGGSTVMEGEELAKALRNSHNLGNVLLTQQTEFTAAQMRKAKEIYRELFGTPAGGTDARSLGVEWAAAMKNLARDLEALVGQRPQYPFMEVLLPLRDRVASMQDKQSGWYITEPAKHEDEFLNAKEDILDKIKSFMAGSQKAIYDEARTFLAQQDANLAYVAPSAPEQIRAVLDDPNCFKGAAIQTLKSELLGLNEQVDLQLLAERRTVEAAVQEGREKILQTPEFQALSPEDQAKITSRIDHHADGLGQITGIAILRDRANGVRRTLVPQMLDEIAAFTQPKTPVSRTQGGGMGERPQAPAPTQPTYVNAADIKVAYGQPYIASEADLDLYLEELKKTLLAEIRAGKKVIV